jgi:hypothetical protein
LAHDPRGAPFNSRRAPSLPQDQSTRIRSWWEEAEIGLQRASNKHR